METDDDVRVVVLDSANEDLYLAHYDVLAATEPNKALMAGRTGLTPWLYALVRLSRGPAMSTSSIRGRALGAGSEFVLASDLRFVSRERAVLAQIEVGH